MATDSKNRQYGGLVFAYDNTSVRLWAPDANDGFSTGRIIYVRDGWGGERNWQASVQAGVSVTGQPRSQLVYADCLCCLVLK